MGGPVAPVPPFTAGAWQGHTGCFYAGSVPPGFQLSVQPGWGAPSASGNHRWLQVSSTDAVAPQVTIADPDNLAYATVAGGTTLRGAVGPVQSPSAVSQSYQATCSTTRQNVNAQPPIVITFPNGATSPQVVIVEYLP